MIKGEVALRSGESAPLEYEIIKVENRWNSNGFQVYWYRQGESNPVAQRITIYDSKNEKIFDKREVSKTA